MTVGTPIAGSHGGQFTIAANGTISFDPDGAFDDLSPGAFRDTRVTVTVEDALGATTDAVITVRVKGVAIVNEAPSAANALPDLTISLGETITPIDVSGDFSDPGDSLRFTATGLPSGLGIDPASGVISGAASGTTGPKTVLITATDSALQSASSGFTLTVDAAPAAPVNSALPQIGGTPEVGQVLSASPGIWSGHPPPSLSYAWRRNGAPIAGATGTSYALTSTDENSSITLAETASNASGTALAVSTAVTVAPAGGLSAPGNLAAPAIIGQAEIGQSLAVTPGSWSGNPAPSLSYQWQRDGTDISGAASNAYTVNEADHGTILTVTETAANSQGSATVTSAATEAVAYQAPKASGGLADQIYTEGVAITPFDTATDFAVPGDSDLSGTSFALAPSSAALPTGLSLSTAGVIAGIPSELASARSIIIRATNSGGSADSGFSLTVDAATGAPDAFAGADWAIADAGTGGRADVTISALPANNGAAISDIEYRINGSAWISAGGLSDFQINGLTDGVQVSVALRAINSVGAGPASAAKTVIPTPAANLANFSAVNADGWSATYPSPPSGDFDPVGSPEVFTVTRSGFNAAGQAITFDEDLVVMKRERQSYPNQASLTADQVTLSDYIYAGDTVPGATNNSTRQSAKPQAMWLHRDLEIATGGSFTARLAVAHRHARNGRPVAAVKFTATDGTNTAETTVSAMTKTDYAASGLSVPHFEGVLDLTGLNTGAVTIDAVIYPWIGEAFTISTDANPYPSILLTTLKVYNDKSSALSPVYAYVDPVSGDNGSGVASPSSATAAASPFADVGAAATAIQGANADFPNTVANGIIRLRDTGDHVLVSFGARADGDWPLIIEDDPANSGHAIFTDGGISGANRINDLLVFRGRLTIQKQGGAVIFLDSAVGGTDYTHLLAFEGVSFDLNGQSTYDAWIYRTGRTWFIDCAGDNARQAQIFSTVQKMCNVIGSANCTGNGVYNAVGSRNGGWGVLTVHTNIPAPRGIFFGWNLSASSTNGANILSVSTPVDELGFAVVGNVVEQSGGDTGPACKILGDGDISEGLNINFMQNTVIGARSNIVYNDVNGSGAVTKEMVNRFSVHSQYNMKSDVFATDGTNTGNWSNLYKVGWRGTAQFSNDASARTPGVGAWFGEIAALDEDVWDGVTPIDPDWVNDASFYGSGLGNGDYRPGAGTQLATITTGQAPYPFDQNGAAIPDDGSARIGALQP